MSTVNAMTGLFKIVIARTENTHFSTGLISTSLQSLANLGKEYEIKHMLKS